MLDLFTHKLVVTVLLVCVHFIVGLSPLFLCRNHHEKKPQVDLFTALCLSLSGGILLATCFIHLVPQVRIAMHYFLPEHTLPVTELLLVAGFFITFFIDEAVISFHQSSANSKVYPDDGGESDSPPLTPPPPTPRAQVWLPTLLLGIHSLAKGVAVGLAEFIPDLWLLFVAAAVHESVAMFGLTLIILHLERGAKTVVILSLGVALFMVVGLLVGTLLSARGVDAVVTAVVRGLAAGNILYVTFYELLTREVRTRAMGLLSHLLALLGFLLMLGIKLLGGQESMYNQRSSSCAQEPSQEPDYEGTYDEENP